jgi:hypothetical protein
VVAQVSRRIRLEKIVPTTGILRGDTEVMWVILRVVYGWLILWRDDFLPGRLKYYLYRIRRYNIRGITILEIGPLLFRFGNPQESCAMAPLNEEMINGQRQSSVEYQVLDQYHSQPRKVKIACSGAGASGLCLAFKIQRMLAPDTYDLTIYEKNTTVGGTWHENTYPGVACDIPAHIYSFTFDPKPDWSHYYAHGEEIQRYFEDFADRHNQGFIL